MKADNESGLLTSSSKTSDARLKEKSKRSGSARVRGQLRVLKADGYSGYLSLETHWRVHREIPEDLLHRPKGSAFSFGGEEAPRLCLQSLREMLVQV